MPERSEYHQSLKVLHWLMAGGFFIMWGSGLYMTTWVQEDSFAEELLFDIHISSGVSLLFLIVIRLWIRYRYAIPAPLKELSSFEVKASHLGHLALYALPLFIIFIGWAETDFGGHGVKWFGLSMPKVFPTMETLVGINLESTTAWLHKWAAYLMLLIAMVHIVAVIKHRLEGHDVLYRMSLLNKKS